MSETLFKEVKSLNDLNFSVACNDIAISPNGKKLIASGIYKPTLKLFDLKNTVMKFERHLVSDPIKNLFLEDNGEKFAILRNDKTIEFHIKGGLHEKIKTVNQPHDIILNKFASELYIGGNYNEINRFNLEQGRFLKSIPCNGATRFSFSEVHTLFGTIFKNNLRFIDPKTKTDVFSKNYEEEIISISQDETGLKYVLGTESGQLLEYDLRSPKVLRSLQFENFLSEIFYSGKNILASTVKKIYLVKENDMKYIETNSINPGFLINTFCSNGGVVFVGGEAVQIKTFVCEDLGKIPDWTFDFND